MHSAWIQLRWRLMGHLSMNVRDSAADGSALNMILQAMTNDAVGSKDLVRTVNAIGARCDAPPAVMTDAMTEELKGISHDCVALAPGDRVMT